MFLKKYPGDTRIGAKKRDIPFRFRCVGTVDARVADIWYESDRMEADCNDLHA